MIFKCSHCEHVFEQEDPAYGWEINYYLESCPRCETPLKSPLVSIRLANGLAVSQFLATIWTAANLFLGRQDMAEFFTWMLIVVTLGMFLSHERKGKPVLRVPQKHT